MKNNLGRFWGESLQQEAVIGTGSTKAFVPPVTPFSPLWILSAAMTTKLSKQSSKLLNDSPGYRVLISTSWIPSILKLTWHPLMNISWVIDATTLSGIQFSAFKHNQNTHSLPISQTLWYEIFYWFVLFYHFRISKISRVGLNLRLLLEDRLQRQWL